VKIKVKKDEERGALTNEPTKSILSPVREAKRERV
jgi:hypothetical protein